MTLRVEIVGIETARGMETGGRGWLSLSIEEGNVEFFLKKRLWIFWLELYGGVKVRVCGDICGSIRQ